MGFSAADSAGSSLRACFPMPRSPKGTTGPADIGQSGKIYIFTWDTPPLQGKMGLGAVI